MKYVLILVAAMFLFAIADGADAKICPQCGRDHLADDNPPSEEKQPEPKPKEEEKEETRELLSVSRARFSAPSADVADACDEILDRLEERYGKPQVWTPFPIYFRAYTGNGIAGYTSYSNVVREVVVYESLQNAKGGTLDHELTHAFFFYYLNSNFDLFLNEGLAQNSEYRRRESLRQTVCRRYNNGEFWTLDKLYGRNSYDNALRIYHEGFSVVDFLIGRGGSVWFGAFMERLVETNDIDRSLFEFYGYQTLKELQSAWLDYVENGQDRSSIKAVL